MAAPIVEFYDETGKTPVTVWNIGEIDANSESDVFKVTLWNNKGRGTAVSSMKRIKMNVVNTKGGDVDLKWDEQLNTVATDENGSDITLAKGPIAQNWINARINYAGADQDADWVAIGGKSSVDVFAAGVDTESDGFSILGSANTGSVTTDIENFANIELKMVVPLDANEGTTNNNIRTTYFYT